ncbi:uncharacterized protein At3g49140-like isoform X3 [Carex rostrata]
MSAGAFANWIRSPFDRRKGLEFHNFRYKSPFGSNQALWLRARHDYSLSKARVAADYSDSLPESTNHFIKHGYHPLEEYKEPKRKIDMFLSDIQLARTIVEINHKAVLELAGWLHCEPHGHSLWSEFEYRVDDHGDILFELPEEGLLQDVHITDFHVYLHRVEEITGFLMERGMPETLQQTHPLHFARCLKKAVNSTFGNEMAWPSNALSIVGSLQSCEEEEYIQRNLLYPSDYDLDRDKECTDGGYESDWSGTDDEPLSHSLPEKPRSKTSLLYRLEIGTMELFSVYGNQTEVHHRVPFCEVEPDAVACSAREIIKHLDEHGTHYLTALRALCRKKKSLVVEEAEIIWVDRLGFDVRAILGREMKILRFSFNTRAINEKAAEKKIMRMLFTRSYVKYLQTASDDIRKS